MTTETESTRTHNPELAGHNTDLGERTMTDHERAKAWRQRAIEGRAAREAAAKATDFYTLVGTIVGHLPDIDEELATSIAELTINAGYRQVEP